MFPCLQTQVELDEPPSLELLYHLKSRNIRIPLVVDKERKNEVGRKNTNNSIGQQYDWKPLSKMKMQWTTVFLALLPPLCLAYPKITSPSGGQSLPGGTTLKVEWADTGDSPKIPDLLNFQLLLYSGDNKNPAQLLTLLAKGTFTTDTATTVSIPVTEGAETTNAYFIGMISVAKTGGTYTTYSDRFTLTGMTGSFAAAVSTALLALASTVTAGPSPVNNLVADAVPAASVTDLFQIAYNMQTGPTLYASMPLLPLTSITATNTEPQYPTSAATIATTFLDDTDRSTTVTQQATYSFASHANTASAAPHPSDNSDMAKYLRRWKDDE